MSFSNHSSNDKSDVESSHESDTSSTRPVDIVNKDANSNELKTLKLRVYDMWALG